MKRVYSHSQDLQDSAIGNLGTDSPVLNGLRSETALDQSEVRCQKLRL